MQLRSQRQANFTVLEGWAKITALKLAPDNDEVKKLRAEVVKLLQLNSS